MIYGRVTRGYKSGGFNADNISSAANFTFGSEYVTNSELGFKSEFLDKRVRLNAALFYMNYADLQVTQFDQATTSNYIANAASATSKGLEVELHALPVAAFDVSADLGLLDATYKKFIDNFGRNLAGKRLQYAPKVTGSVAARYTIAIRDGLGLVMRAEADYRGDMEGSPENSPTDLLNGYTLFNARLGLQTQHFDVTLWANNLADKRYALNRFTHPKLLLGYSESVVTYAPPRAFGVTATYRF